MPETVALMHSLVGLAAVLIAIAAVLHEGAAHDGVHRFELFLGCFVGAITFTASVVAYLASCRRKVGSKSAQGWLGQAGADRAGPGHDRPSACTTSPAKTCNVVLMHDRDCTGTRLLPGSPRSVVATCRWWCRC
jgi:hypothetical protein